MAGWTVVRSLRVRIVGGKRADYASDIRRIRARKDRVSVLGERFIVTE